MAALPKPERGLVISYAYLWAAEHAQGREEGAKDRPCVIILVVEKSGGDVIVTVAPITHSPPGNFSAAVELPAMTKNRLGLDDSRSWVIATEGNRFVWPGPDIRMIAPGRTHYGFIPPALFRQIQERFAAVYRAGHAGMVNRTI